MRTSSIGPRKKRLAYCPYLAATSILDQIGVPYDRIVLKGANATALQLVAGTLSDGAGSGKYQGIILETGDLPYLEPACNCFPSALTAAQWTMLRQYQSDFGVRSATLYTRPGLSVDTNGAQVDLSYGLVLDSARTTDDFTPEPDPPVTGTLTPSGANVFSYLNSASPVIVKNAYTYLATPAVGAQTVPLLSATEGTGTFAIASTYAAPAGATTVGVAPGGWENLAITADSNPEVTHALLMGYGVVNWVTKGVFLGERKIYMTAQPDDLLIPDDLWDPVTKTTPNDNTITGYISNPDFRYRNTGADYASLVSWQSALQANPKMAAFRLEMPFNGVGYNTSDTEFLNKGETTDSLSPAVRGNPNAFRWINHTWDHSSLNVVNPSDPDHVTPTVASITNLLTWNDDLAMGRRSGNPDDGRPRVEFANYVKSAFIQPDISGLENPVFWEAAQNFGLQYILMDTSKPYENFIPSRAPISMPNGTTALTVISPNTGYTSSLDTHVPGNPRIFIIPRYPTSLYYNVSTPDEWVSEYNHFYGVNGIVPPPDGQTSWFGGNSSYAQILDRESDTLVRYMLKYHVNSWMFHAANLRAYPGGNGKSTLGDLLDAVAGKYTAMYNLPVLSPSQAEIGEIMKARMAYNAAIAGGLKGKVVYGPTVRIELTNPSSVRVRVPVTGVNVGGAEYGGQMISTLLLEPGGATSFPAPPAWIPQQNDLSITTTASAPRMEAGGVLIYTLVMANAGPSTANGATFADTLPSGLGTITSVNTDASAGSAVTFSNANTSLFGTLTIPPGGSVKVTFQVSVMRDFVGSLTNEATVSPAAGAVDPSMANNISSASVLVTPPTTCTRSSFLRKGTCTSYPVAGGEVP